MKAGIRLHEGELATLIREATHGKYIQLDWLIRGTELKDIPSNEWAMRRVAEMRGIELPKAIAP